jgi:hypothetical protein
MTLLRLRYKRSILCLKDNLLPLCLENSHIPHIPKGTSLNLQTIDQINLTQVFKVEYNLKANPNNHKKSTVKIVVYPIHHRQEITAVNHHKKNH